MAILNRVKSLFTSAPIGGAGVVNRNYSKQPVFDPHRQVNGITYKAIDKIGMSLSVYDPKVLKANGDTYVNHPLLSLYRQPNSRATAIDFIHLYGMLFEIYGETFWYLARGENTRRVKEIYLLNPMQVKLEIDNGELIGYTLHKNNGDNVPLELDEVIHDKRPNPFNEWRGMSVLEKAAVYIDTELTTSQFTLSYMNNAASPSGIVTLPDMSSDVFRQFTQKWREGYEGPENAGKTAFIRGGEARFQAVGATLKDVDQKITREMAKDDVLMMLDVPKGLFGASGEKGLGRNELEPLEYIFAKHKIDPIMKRLDRIYEKIGQSFGREGVINVEHTSVIPSDKDHTHKVHKDLVNVALTVNEVRQELGYEPIKGGDELKADARPTVEQPQKQANVKIVAKKPITKAMKAKQLADEQEQFFSELIESSEVYERKVKRKISKFADEQQKAVISKINASEKSFEEWLYEVKEASEELTALLIPVLLELMEAQSEDVAHFITGELLKITPEIERDIKNRSLRIAGQYNKDTLNALQATLTEGQKNGESLVKLKKRVEATYGDAKGYRAERIARSESLHASNKAAELTYKQSGFSVIRWVTSPGACEFCATFEGRTKEVGSKYVNVGDVVTGSDGNQLKIDYEDIDVPPLHPNCTCSLLPEVSDE